jgi:hypothetical protein
MEEEHMKAVKAIYEKGKIKLSEKPAEQGPLEVLVVFPDDGDDSWQAILNETSMRPSFQRFVEECQEEIRQGKSRPLNLDDL